MNRRMKFLRIIKIALLLVAFAVLWPAAAPVAPADETTPQAARSVFNLPANPKEGRDPFFPSSSRPYQSQTPANTSVGDLSSIVMQGITGPPDHRLAIINNVTFGVGDDAEVRTPQGRIQIHCVEIGADSAVIEADGQRRELHYGEK